MKKIFTALTIISALFITQNVFAEKEAALKSAAFKNQRGSVLHLTWNHKGKNTGTLTGTFTNAVACKEGIGKALPISGFFSGDAIAIVVNSTPCKFVLSMSGHFTAQKEHMDLLWVITNQSKDPMGHDIQANLVGSDFYDKTND